VQFLSASYKKCNFSALLHVTFESTVCGYPMPLHTSGNLVVFTHNVTNTPSPPFQTIISHIHVTFYNRRSRYCLWLEQKFNGSTTCFTLHIFVNPEPLVTGMTILL